MKINWNRKYTTIAVYTLIVIAVAVLFVVFVFKFDDFTKVFSKFSGVIAPAICGIVIAFILNPLMMYIENKFFRKLKEGVPQEDNIVMRKLLKSSVGDSTVVRTLEKHEAPIEKKIRRRQIMARIFSMIITIVIVLALLVGIVVAVAPSFIGSIVDLAEKMPEYLEKVEAWVNKVFEDNPNIAEFISTEVTNFAGLINKIAEELKPMAGNIVGNVSEWLMNFLGTMLTGVKNFLIGFIIAIYLLYSKERLLGQCKKILIAFFKENKCKTMFGGLAKANDIFKKYIISNLLDAMIIFVFMLIGMFAMGMPYQTLIAVVCGVTNLIPFFGPFIGAIPCAVLILLVDPIKVIWFAIFVLVIQQTDGNVIKPFLFGETLGLPAIWVLISITVGGGLFGIPGMLLGAPVFAVFYLMFAEFIAGKLKKKNLPDETEAYVGSFKEFSDTYFEGEPAADAQGTAVLKKSPPLTEKTEKFARDTIPKPASKPDPKSSPKPNPNPRGNRNNRKKQ